MNTEPEQTPKSESATSTEGSTPTTNAHLNDAIDSIQQIPKKEELHAFSIEKLFAGRLDRTNYIYGIIVGLVVCAVLYRVMLVGAIAGLVLGVIGIATTARRFRDINVTGWLALLCLVPVVGLIVVIYLCIAEQVNAGNRFGDTPDPRRPFFYAILNI